MSQNSSAKYYQDSQERLQRKLVKDIKVFLKRRKRDNLVVNDTNIYQNTKSKDWLSIEKDIMQ